MPAVNGVTQIAAVAVLHALLLADSLSASKIGSMCWFSSWWGALMVCSHDTYAWRYTVQSPYVFIPCATSSLTATCAVYSVLILMCRNSVFRAEMLLLHAILPISMAMQLLCTSDVFYEYSMRFCFCTGKASCRMSSGLPLSAGTSLAGLVLLAYLLSCSTSTPYTARRMKRAVS